MNNIIINESDYQLINRTFKSFSKILFEDNFSFLGNESPVYSFDSIEREKVKKVNTAFSSFYFSTEEDITYFDFFTSSIVTEPIFHLTEYDHILIPSRKPYVNEARVKIDDHLFLKNFNFSTSFTELLVNFNLPKKFLLKALLTGCPDDQWPEAKKWNQQLKTILKQKNYETIDQLRQEIINTYTSKFDTNDKYLSKDFLDLLGLYLEGDFQVLSHTSINFFPPDEETFKKLITITLKFNVNKIVSNNKFRKKCEGVTSILVNSSLFFDLFSSEFQNMQNILQLRATEAEYFKNILLNLKNIRIKKYLTAKYLQEFLSQFNIFYSIKDCNNYYSLERIPGVIKYQEYYMMPISSIDTLQDNEKVSLIRFN